MKRFEIGVLLSLSCVAQAAEIWGSQPAAKLFDATDALFGLPEFGGNGECSTLAVPFYHVTGLAYSHRDTNV